MVSKQALILFAHGSRDARWAEPLVRLQQLIETQLDSSVSVHQAFLEIMSPSLPELVAQLAAQGCQKIAIVPIFLGQGGHVRRDLPQLVAQLEIDYPQVQFSLAPAIGENEQVLMAIAGVCAASLNLCSK